MSPVNTIRGEIGAESKKNRVRFSHESKKKRDRFSVYFSASSQVSAFCPRGTPSGLARARSTPLQSTTYRGADVERDLPVVARERTRRSLSPPPRLTPDDHVSHPEGRPACPETDSPPRHRAGHRHFRAPEGIPRGVATRGHHGQAGGTHADRTTIPMHRPRMPRARHQGITLRHTPADPMARQSRQGCALRRQLGHMAQAQEAHAHP